jgi:hypothetical protein
MACQIEGLDFALSIETIAQHYQYPTQLLDLPWSRDVAMFFATCKYDQAGDVFYLFRLVLLSSTRWICGN